MAHLELILSRVELWQDSASGRILLVPTRVISDGGRFISPPYYDGGEMVA